MDEVKRYYMGIDLGTDSCGWCVTDQNFRIIKKSGKHLWGIRLFDDAKTAKERRSFRTQRKRLQRRRYRIACLREIMGPAIEAVDKDFFQRLDNSNLFDWKDESKKIPLKKDSLFNDPQFHDKEFFRAFPTAYHLRSYLLTTSKRVDIRWIYLALAHIIKYRGNFLNPNEDSNGNMDLHDIKNSFQSINAIAQTIYDQCDDPDLKEKGSSFIGFGFKSTGSSFDPDSLNSFEITDEEAIKVKEIFKNCTGVTETFEKLANLFDEAVKNKFLSTILKLICGGKVNSKDLFLTDDYVDDQNFKSIKLDDWDEKLEPNLSSINDVFASLLQECKALYDAHNLTNLLGDYHFISQAMAGRWDEQKDEFEGGRYNEHRSQLRDLKHIVKTYYPDKYSVIFRDLLDKGQKDDGKENYPSLIGSSMVNRRKIKSKHAKIDDFYSFLKKTINLDDLYKRLKDSSLPAEKDDLKIVEKINEDIKNRKFLLRQNSGENGYITHQLHRAELLKIIDKFKADYPCLGEKDDRGNYKILDILMFKIPYYIGPLDNNSKNVNSWARRVPVNHPQGKIKPWNWDEFVDKPKAAEEFVERMVNKCSYLLSEKTLPANSLIYTKYKVLNEINKIAVSIDGSVSRFFSQDEKDSLLKLYEEKGKPTLSDIKNWAKLYFSSDKVELSTSQSSDRVNKLDKNYLQSNLNSYRDFKNILGDINHTNFNIIESIIRDITIFEDKSILDERLRNINISGHKLNDEQISKIKNLNYKGWGALSAELLDGIKGMDHAPQSEEEIESADGPTILEAMEKVSEDENGNYHSDNFMEVLNNSKYHFSDIINFINEEKGAETYKGFVKYIEDSFGSPMMKRATIQAMKVIREAEHIIGHPIDRFFIESTKSPDKNQKGKNGNDKLRSRELSKRYEQIMKSISASDQDKINKDANEKLKGLIGKNDNSKFRIKRVYLYFLQMGKDVYTGEDLSFDDVLKGTDKYDIDHIIPRSMIKDDSLDNTVLTSKAVNNQMKGDRYPIPRGVITSKGREAIEFLHRNGLISSVKYKRLLRTKDFTAEELAGFINRQLTSTSQSVKALGQVLKIDTDIRREKAKKSGQGFEEYRNPNWKQVIVYPRASNTHDFRVLFDFPKCREVNDFHHAHDAYLNIVVGEVYRSKYGDIATAKKIKELRERKINEDGSETGPTNVFGKIWDENIKRTGSGDTSRFDWIPDTKDKSKKDATIRIIKKEISRKDILFTRMPIEKNGGLWDINIISPKGKDNLVSHMSIKNSPKDSRLYKLHDVEKYGYYNNPSALYFSVIRAKVDKNKDFSYYLVPVPSYILSKNALDDNLVSYYKVNGFDQPEIIIKKVLLNTICSYDDDKSQPVYRFMIASKTGKSIKVYNAWQAYYPDKFMCYGKLISSFVDKYIKNKDLVSDKEEEYKVFKGNSKDWYDIPIPDKISKENNLELYDFLAKQFSKNIYKHWSIFSKLGESLPRTRDGFISSSLVDQTLFLECLINSLHPGEFNFKSAPEGLLKLNNCKKQSGMLKINQSLGPGFKLYAQSPTGFYENVIFAIDKNGNEVSTKKNGV